VFLAPFLARFSNVSQLPLFGPFLEGGEKHYARVEPLQPIPRAEALLVTPYVQFVMKNLLAPVLVLLSLSACQKEDLVEAEDNAYPQTWQLVQMTGNFPAFTKTGADLPWQETYVFRSDSTFTKTRQQGAQLEETRGTFSVRDNAPGMSLVLTYPADTDLLTNCSATPQEYLRFQGNEVLIGSSEACDGPRFEYKKSR
jgi:hypothetical protein